MTDANLKTVAAEPAIVTVKRSFAASAERVFDAWLDPDVLGEWMFDPALRGEQVLRLSTDPRCGGAFSFRVRRDGKEIEYIGKYLEIERPRRLVFTWAVAPESPEPGIASRVAIDIVPRGEKCDLTLVQELPARLADYARPAVENWTSELAVLAIRLSSDA